MLQGSSLVMMTCLRVPVLQHQLLLAGQKLVDGVGVRADVLEELDQGMDGSRVVQ